MSVHVSIIDGVLPAARAALAGPAAPPDGAVGGFLVFEGIARALEDDRTLAALEYEAYEPMAREELRRLSEDVLAKHGLLALLVEHSRGRVAVGKCSFRLAIWSRHRKEALAAMDEFIDRMKRDVPIWKHPVFA